MKKVVFVSACAVLGINGFAENVITEDVSVAETESLKNKDLHEVVVKGTKAHSGTPIAFTNLSKDEISKNNFGQDIPYLISQTPNVIVTSDAGTGIGYTGFRVRGTDANRINVTVNGVPLNDSESHTVFWVNMPDFASSVENVQIQRGAGTSLYGAASFGSTIGMETSKPNLQPHSDYYGAGGSF